MMDIRDCKRTQLLPSYLVLASRSWLLWFSIAWLLKIKFPLRRDGPADGIKHKRRDLRVCSPVRWTGADFAQSLSLWEDSVGAPRPFCIEQARNHAVCLRNGRWEKRVARKVDSQRAPLRTLAVDSRVQLISLTEWKNRRRKCFFG